MGDAVRTYGELDRRARRLASVLKARGAGPSRPVAAVLPNGIEAFEVAVAAAMINAPYLPVNWHLKADELAYILTDADVAVAVGEAGVTDEALAAALDHHPAGSLLVGADYEKEIESATPLPGADSGAGPELMFYTSGTTARPKGVVHTSLSDDSGRARGMEGQVALWGWTADDVYVMSGPAYHASHLGWGLCSLYVGATTIITSQFEARSFLEEVARHRGTRSFMVPAHFIRILEIPAQERATLDVSSFALIVHAAAPCPVAVKYKMMEAFPHAAIHELYGASEGGATKISPEEWRVRPGSVGKPWPGVEIRILDDEGNPVVTCESGIIYIRPPGPQKFKYRNDDDATSRAWRDDAFTVGDIGFLDAEGYLTITDRVKDIIIRGGENVSAAEVEQLMAHMDGVAEVAVVAAPDEKFGEHGCAFFRMQPGKPAPDLEAVRAHLSVAGLARQKWPEELRSVEDLPRTPSGKVQKFVLRDQLRANAP
jgi:long-chain acyl-CoA synthetase